MRIQFLISSDRHSGAAVPMLRLAAQLQEAGHHVHFSCKKVRDWCDNPLHEHAQKAGLPWDTDLHLNNKIHPTQYLHDVRLLARRLKKERIDILHCHYKPDHLIGAAACWLAGGETALVRSRHHSRLERRDPLHRWLFRRCTHAVTEISEPTAVQDEERLRLGGKTTVIYGAVDAEALAQVRPHPTLRQELNLPDDAFLIGYPARLVPKRHPEELLTLAAPYLRAHPKAVLLLIGRGPLEESMGQQIAAQKLAGQVKILGYREDFLAVVAAMDVVVYMREGTDGGCRALLEAMGLGRAIIAPSMPPMLELLGDGGLFFDDSSEDSFANALASLGSEAQRLPWQQKAQARTAERFTEERRLADFLAAYDTALKNTATAR